MVGKVDMTDILVSFRCKERVSAVPPQASYLFEYILCPIYERVASMYPSTWSPNKVTLTGIFATTISSLLMLTSMPVNTAFEPPHVTVVPASYYLNSSFKRKAASGPSPLHPSMLQPPFSRVFTPTSLLLLCGFLNLVYCIADNTDGCLARRLRKASNVGEYMDHGLDCVTSLMSTCVSMSVIGFSFPNIAVTVALVAMLTILSHTLNYERNIFVWGNRFVSVDEAMLFFFLVNWVSLLFPGLGTATLSPPILDMFLPQPLAQLLYPLRYIDAALIGCWISQCFVLISISAKNWCMLFRMQTLASFLSLVFLFAIVPYHTLHMEKEGLAAYTLGPLSYVSVWIITLACTLSSIVHIPIYARCAGQLQTELLPLAGVIFIFLTFSSFPAVAMVLAVVWHIGQICCNVSRLKALGVKTE
uniref:Ethanolamine phosphotransferase n=1 Tax=Trypanosoma congolense (strain IL3000) TaxID=1068625 RepID=G0UY93_TRYCI|nr:conserved hypothetical protein [Trypanosoma congolense IL3000]